MKRFELNFYDVFGIMYKIFEIAPNLEEAKRNAIRRYKHSGVEIEKFTQCYEDTTKENK